MRAIILALVLLVSAQARGLTIDPTRTVRVVGEVSFGILTQAQELLDLAEKSQAPIYLIINSPGGAVLPGNIFIDAMDAVKAQGVPIRCITTIMAASMAFNIYANCNDRYATKNALLLFHPVRTMSREPVKADDAQTTADELAKLDSEVLTYLIDRTGMNPLLLIAAFYKEKLWMARELKKHCKAGFMTIIPYVKGAKDLYKVD